MRKECWRACVQAKKEGKVKSIGISTFGVLHMKQLIEEDTVGLEVPAVHQVRNIFRKNREGTNHASRLTYTRS